MAGDLFWSSTEEGISELEAFFEYAGYKARDLREPLHQAKDHVQSVMELQFLTEGEYRSGGWQPLARGYEKWKLKHSGGEPILELDPALLLSGDHGTPRGEKMRDVVLSDSSWYVGMEEAEFLPDSTRAAWHQEGADRSRGGVLPSRPILDLNEYDYQYIEEVFVQWLDELRTANIRRGPADASLRPPIFG